MSATINQLDELAARAQALYSRPTVAMELVRLAEEPRVDGKALRDCVAQDPALACKILRVVNSSLFGLNRPVGDLNQAIGLLGIKPLKLLVLGFSLPDSLFAEVAARELRWYWTNTLTRAVAARLIAEQLWRQPGDEAFIAGLLQDIGILVLLRELGEPYVRFLTGVIEERCHLASLERDTIGFDHIQLSAALLRRWQLPSRLVDAIEAPKRMARLARMDSPEADLPQVLHLADLLMQLVGQRRLHVLAELLEAGRVYRGMTKSMLTSLVEDLQPQVDQLGQALSLELTGERDYKQTLLDAHRQMAALCEQIAGGGSGGEGEERAYADLLTHSNDLTSAMDRFLRGDSQNASESAGPTAVNISREGDSKSKFALSNDRVGGVKETVLARKLIAAAVRCREQRQELSLIVLEPSSFDVQSDPAGDFASHRTRRALARACETLNDHRVSLLSLSERRSAAIVSNCDRSTALAIAQNAITELGRLERRSVGSSDVSPTTLSAGVATASVVAKNFDPDSMIECAVRCLNAARGTGTSAVKSIAV
jgi:HD-like signal output (HDOD) protein